MYRYFFFLLDSYQQAHTNVLRTCCKRPRRTAPRWNVKGRRNQAFPVFRVRAVERNKLLLLPDGSFSPFYKSAAWRMVTCNRGPGHLREVGRCRVRGLDHRHLADANLACVSKASAATFWRCRSLRQRFAKTPASVASQSTPLRR